MITHSLTYSLAHSLSISRNFPLSSDTQTKTLNQDFHRFDCFCFLETISLMRSEDGVCRHEEPRWDLKYRDLGPIMTRSHPAGTCCQGKGHGKQDTTVCTSQISVGMTQSHIVTRQDCGLQFILNPTEPLKGHVKYIYGYITVTPRG